MTKAEPPFATAGRVLVVALISVALVGGSAITGWLWPWCPIRLAPARVELDGPFADVVLEGKAFRVGASALLDYSLRSGPWPSPDSHPLGVVATISAVSRDALGEPVFTCVRVTRGGETWARRPVTYGTQTRADGYPPGAPPPVPNEAWRLGVANDGPEWPAGDTVALELWAAVHGRHYLFALPPFPLRKGL